MTTKRLTPSLRTVRPSGERPSWDEYFVNMLPAVAARSTCLSRKVGAILTLENRIIGTGYNGPLPGYPHCDTTGCIRIDRNIPSGERLDICRAVHAERNAIDYSTVKTAGATLYCTCSPCKFCAERIVTAQISRIVVLERYQDDLSTEILRYSGISLEYFEFEA